MDFKIRVEGTYGCAGFRDKLCIHIISHMMRVVLVTDGIIVKIANVRHSMDEDEWWGLQEPNNGVGRQPTL